MTQPLPLRVTVNDSLVVLPDGLVFTLFIPAGHHEIAAGVLRILDQYWAMPHVNPPTQVFRRGEEYEPCTAKTLASVRRRLEKGTRSHFMVTLRDGQEPELPAYRFEYYGTEAEREPSDDSYVEVWFPRDYPERIGTAAFIDALRRMAEAVPFASGYCSLALYSKTWPSNDVVRPLVLRHPGIDIPDNDCACDLGTQIRGAYWLTLLGQPALLGLGKLPSDVKAELGPEITIHDLANGVLLQAGERSEPGDVESGDVLPLIRRVAKYLEPIQLYQRVAVLFDDLALCNEWLRRHLT
jgi:hypothetical protein